MKQKFVNGIPTGEFTQGDLIQAGPFDTYDECQEGNASPSVTPDNPDMQYRWVASNEPWCEGTDEYKTEKQQQSADSGKSWTDSGATRKGEFVQSYSFACGFVAERWAEVNPNVDFICENGNKYYLQKKQISHDGVNWIDSGDTRKGPLIESQSDDCGYPQYRWVEIPLDIDYECVGDSKYYKEKEQVTNDGIVWQDTGRTRRGRGAEVHSADCGYVPPTTVTRWVVVEGEFVCQGVNKHKKEKEQISNDSGHTWQDTSNTRAGALIESESYSCGYISYRWVDAPGEYVCQGYDKYQKQNEEMTTNGQVWTPTGRTRTGALIERNSYDCQYISYRWVTVEGEFVCSGTDKYTKEKEQSSTDGSVWQDTGRERAGSLIERDSSYCKEPPTPVSSDYLTFTALEDGTFGFGSRDLYYSLDKVEWTRLTSSYETPTIAAGNKIYFKGTITPKEHYGVGTFSSTGRFTASGNVMSLIYGDDFVGKTSLSGKSYAFSNLFWQCPNLISIDGLSLPATTLSDWCYLEMFYGCSGLTSIPSDLLPSTTLADHCYVNMFTHCEGLTSIPSGLLPANTLKQHCYAGMFSYCYGLTSIQTGLFLATTLAPYCCANMFSNCTSLTTIPSDLLKATTLADHCYYEMFYECSGLTSIPSGLLPSTTLGDNCYNSMFAYCTGLITIPSGLLLATTLAPYCCANMFYKCSKLTTIPSDLLKATTLADHCYYYMFGFCTNITTAPDLPADTLVSRCYERMFYKCAKLNSIRMLATDVSATECLINWVSGVASSGTFYKKSGVTIPRGISGIPSGWTVVEV